MPNFTVTGPDGKKYPITGPEGATQDDAEKEVYRQHGWERGNLGKAADNSLLGRAAEAVDPGPFIKGVGQGIIGIPEAIYQGAEKFGAPRVPEAIRAPLRRFSDEAGKTWGGVAGETVGNVLGFLGGGEVADALGLAAKVPGVVSRVAASPMTQAVIAQPTKSDNLQDFLTQKAEDAGLGWLLNRLFLKRPTQQAAHDVAQSANDAASAQHAQTVATEEEQHKALSEAQKLFHQGERSKQQAAADALNQQTQQALTGRQAQLTQRSQVPQQTTGGWWQRTGEKIGEPISADARPETGAQVQAKVGARLNSITDRMTLDPADTSFTEQLNEIRRQTHSSLQAHNQAGFFTQPPTSELERLIHDPANAGRMFPRTTMPEPKQPTGMWADQVLDPLKKGPLSGRQLTQYITRLGNEANTLATRARAAAPGTPEQADLLAQASALRQVQDTVIGHAAGNADDKLALEQARQAYMMWGVGNDAAKASRGGVATPAQLIQMMTKRLGEARYKQALVDPQSPYHDAVTWLQQQLGEHTARVPSATEVRAAQPQPPPKLPARPTPIPPPTARTPPTPRDVPPAPKRPKRDLLRAAEHATLGAVMHHNLPVVGWQAARVIDALRGRGTGGTEGTLEGFIRRALTRDPTRAGRVGRATAGTAANRAQKAVPRDLRKAAENVVGAGAQIAEPYLNYRWPGQ